MKATLFNGVVFNIRKFFCFSISTFAEIEIEIQKNLQTCSLILLNVFQNGYIFSYCVCSLFIQFRRGLLKRLMNIPRILPIVKAEIIVPMPMEPKECKKMIESIRAEVTVNTSQITFVLLIAIPNRLLIVGSRLSYGIIGIEECKFKNIAKAIKIKLKNK